MREVPKFDKKAHAWLKFCHEYDEDLNETYSNMSKSESSPEFQIMLDSGTDRHMVNELHRLSNVVLLKNPLIIGCADQTAPSLVATDSGDFKIEIKSRFDEYMEITLYDTLYVPNLSRSLISGELIVESDRYRIDY